MLIINVSNSRFCGEMRYHSHQPRGWMLCHQSPHIQNACSAAHHKKKFFHRQILLCYIYSSFNEQNHIQAEIQRYTWMYAYVCVCVWIEAHVSLLIFKLAEFLHIHYFFYYYHRHTNICMITIWRMNVCVYM